MPDLKVLNPVAPSTTAPVVPTVRPAKLDGQVLAVLINGKEYSDVVLRRVVSQIQAKHQLKEVLWWDKKFAAKPAPFLDEIVKLSTLVLNGVGH